MNLSENIYTLRTAHNMSQTDLAQALEVSRQSVSKWENNSAVPDLDRLIKMSELFDVTLDELVFGQKLDKKSEAAPPQDNITQFNLSIKPNIATGVVMLIFGMVFFLLSIFWGDHLWFGEEIGELMSITVTLVAISILATNDFKIFSACAVVHFLYSLLCFGILHITTIANYIFIFISGCILLIWFLVWGTNASKEADDTQKASH